MVGMKAGPMAVKMVEWKEWTRAVKSVETLAAEMELEMVDL